MTMPRLLQTLAMILVVNVAMAQSWQGQFDRSDSVLRVRNPEFSISPPETMTAELMWRLDDNAEDHILGRVNKIETGVDGCAYLLDEQVKEIAVYDAEGRYLRSLGRDGDGPGEFRMPWDLVARDDGSILVLQIFPGKVTGFSSTGDPLPSYPLPPVGTSNGAMLSDADQSSLGLVAHQYQIWVDDDGGLTKTQVLVAIDAEGEVVTTYCERTTQRHPGDNVRVEGVYWDFLSDWDVSPHDQVIVRTSWEDYELTVYAPNGDIDRIITREYSSRQRRPELVSALQKYNDEAYEGRRWRANVGPIVYRASEQDGDIQMFASRGDASIWVLTSRGAYDVPEGVLGTFDVFDNEGRFIRQVTLLGEGDYWQDQFIISRDRLYVITNVGSIVPGWHRPGGADRSEEAQREILCFMLPD